MQKLAFVLALLFIKIILPHVATAQIDDQPLIDRLCNKWTIDHIESKGQVEKRNTEIEFKFILRKDSTLLQGLYPDGMIPSHWTLDKKNMILDIKDDKTSMKYRMKIIRISVDELILQDLSADDYTLIYYKRDKD